MCGIIGMITDGPVNQRIYDGLMLLQHRGQDAAGITTLDGLKFRRHRGQGLIREVFRTRNMRDLTGDRGIAYARYPTRGSIATPEECQPFYADSPFGIAFAMDGNITNASDLRQELYDFDRRHVNADNNCEVLLNILASEIFHVTTDGRKLTKDGVFDAMRNVYRRAKGSYAAVALIAGKGMLAFRDPHAIRPLCYGIAKRGEKTEYMFSSESVTMNALGFEFVRDLKPGEAIWIDMQGNLSSRVCAEDTGYNPCAFEYVYLARPDSTIDGVNVYASRLALGKMLAEVVKREMDLSDIDVVMPIPDSARPCAQELAAHLNLPYREGFIKNRYVGRTFIMPGQAVRKKTVRLKLNAMPIEFEGKNVLLVDDSIVRGTTMGEIVGIARESGAKKVYVASSAPRVMYPNVYGIDMPTRKELICGDGKSAEEVAKILGADRVIYPETAELEACLSEINPEVKKWEVSCFTGEYITGDITPEYLEALENGTPVPEKLEPRIDD